METASGGSEHDLALRPLEQAEPLFSQVATRLIEAMEAGVFRPGSALPTEHSLARQFGVSRSSVREALCCLRFSGYVRAARGSGSFVTTPHKRPKEPQRPGDVIDLLEARLATEPLAVALTASAVRQGQNIANLDSVRSIAIGTHLFDMTTGTDLDLHRVLLEACPNQALAAAALLLLERSDGPLWTSVRNRAWDDGRLPRQWLGHHQAVAEAVMQGEAERASTKMAEHLASVVANVAATTALDPAERRRAGGLVARHGAGLGRPEEQRRGQDAL